MSQENGKENKDEKKSTDSQDTVESLQAKLKAAESEKATLLKETMSRKEKLEKLEQEKQKAEETRLAEQGEYKTLVDKYKPDAEKLALWAPRVEKLLELELKDIPADKHDVIPAFQDPFEKLEWLKNARAKGIFGNESKVPNSINSKTDTSKAGLPEFVSWSADDPRLSKLPTKDFMLWKAHNRVSSSGVKGW